MRPIVKYICNGSNVELNNNETLSYTKNKVINVFLLSIRIVINIKH